MVSGLEGSVSWGERDRPEGSEYGFRTRSGGKASGKRYLLKIARLISSTAFAAIAAEIGWGIEDQMKAVAK